MNEQALRQLAKNRRLQGKSWAVIAWIALITGTITQEYALVIGACPAFLLAMLYKDIANLQVTMAGMIGDASKR